MQQSWSSIKGDQGSGSRRVTRFCKDDQGSATIESVMGVS